MSRQARRVRADLLRKGFAGMKPIDRVLETVLYVDDLTAAEEFYRDVLGFELYSKKDGLFVFFRCGGGMLLLFEPEAASKGRSVPAHVERQVFFLISRQRDGENGGPQKCWTAKKCPPQRKKQCPAWEFRAGELCWSCGERPESEAMPGKDRG